MRIWSPIILIGLLLMVPYFAHGVDIQYLLSNGHVQSISDSSIPSIDNYGVVTLVGHTASEIIWPVPSCCGTGELGWSRITDPDTITISGGGMALRTDLVFFKTTSPLLIGCHGVNNWKSLKTLMLQALIAGVPEGDIVATLNYYNGWYYARCDDAPTNQNCIDWKAQLNTLNTVYPSRAQGISSTTNAAVLVSDTFTFKDAQCKANPGGPFC
jgi:hypothetical protein